MIDSLYKLSRTTEVKSTNSPAPNRPSFLNISFQNTNPVLAVGVGSSIVLFRGWSSGSDELDSLSYSEKPTIETEGVVAH